MRVLAGITRTPTVSMLSSSMTRFTSLSTQTKAACDHRLWVIVSTSLDPRPTELKSRMSPVRSEARASA